MLKSYFNHMFDKVMEDGLLSVHPDGQSAVFHTGLLTRSDQDIYAVFVPNERDDAQDWFFRGFSTRDGIDPATSSRDTKNSRFVRASSRALSRPTTTRNPARPECDWTRLLTENVSRIPRQLIYTTQQTTESSCRICAMWGRRRIWTAWKKRHDGSRMTRAWTAW